MRALARIFRSLLAPRAEAFGRDCAEPRMAQERRLRAILHAGAETAFGREHGYARLRTFGDFRRAVPLRPPGAFAPWIARIAAGETHVLTPEPVRQFTKTSGTSGTPKLCPVTRAFTREHHGAHLLWLWHLVGDRPAIAGGRYLTVVSPAVSESTAGGIPVGSMSGRQYRNQAWPVRRRHAAPVLVGEVEDWDARYHALLVFALGREDLTAATAVNPSTLVLLAETLAERAEPLLEDLARGRLANAGALTPTELRGLERRLRPRPERARILRERLRADGRLLPRAAWPGLASIHCWLGGSAPFYLKRMEEPWGGAPRRCLGLRASEGTFSIPLEDGTPAGVLAVGAHVMEFLPEGTDPAPDAETLLAHELDDGRRYRLVITTSGGFARYDLGDIVEVRGFRDRTPRVAFLHKAGGVLSVTGEKVTEDQVVGAMEATAGAGPALAGFTCTEELTRPPRRVLAMEPAAGDPSDASLRARLRAFEDALAERNGEDAEKRASGRLGTPAALLLAPGSYRAHRAALAAEGRPDGQIKPPHLVPPSGEGPAPVPGDAFFARVRVLRRIAFGEPGGEG